LLIFTSCSSSSSYCFLPSLLLVSHIFLSQAQIDVDFPEDVFLNHADFWCSSNCSTTQEEEAEEGDEEKEPCDYTVRKERGCKNHTSPSSGSDSTTSSSSSSGSGSGSSSSSGSGSSAPKRICDPRLCVATTSTSSSNNKKKENEWKKLELGEAREERFYEIGASVEYRLFLKNKYACSYLRVLVVPRKGAATLAVATPKSWRNYITQEGNKTFTVSNSSPEQVRSFETPFVYNTDRKGYLGKTEPSCSSPSCSSLDLLLVAPSPHAHSLSLKYTPLLSTTLSLFPTLNMIILTFPRTFDLSYRHHVRSWNFHIQSHWCSSFCRLQDLSRSFA
jgi:hypothetical protein